MNSSTATDGPVNSDSHHVVTDQQFILLSGSIFIIAACSLIYELLISSLSTYLLGSSVIHYSLTIGLFLFFMGVGAWFAQSIFRDLVAAFVAIEIAIGAVGGVSAMLLYGVYAWSNLYYPAMLLTIAAIGILVGMELPLLTRILESRSGLRRGISQVMTFDYLGALIASLLFPFILLPYLGHLLTASAIGGINLLVAFIVAWTFKDQLGKWTWPIAAGCVVASMLLITSALWSNPAAENLAIVDLPDPESEDVAKLYSVAFYERLARRLSADGVMITQATSPWFARRAFWSIGATMAVVFEDVRPATVYVPSFGLWGFFIAAQHSLENTARTPFPGRYVNQESLPGLLQLPPDLPRLSVEVNRSQSLPVMNYYREGWETLNQTLPLATE